jgi:DnaA family protein
MPPRHHVPQLPLGLRYPPDQRLGTFVEAPDGAIAQLGALATGESGDWLFVSGPSGAGKTHLLFAVCASAQEVGRRPTYLSLRDAQGRVRDALQAFEGLDVVALDDLDSIAGRRDDEIALFDFHNRARSLGTSVLYAASARPDALDLALPDLKSRLGQCIGISLPLPGDEVRREVLRQRAQRRGLLLDAAALDWLMRRVGRELGSLTQLFDRLDRAALAAQRRLTVPFLREVLAGSEAPRPRQID